MTISRIALAASLGTALAGGTALAQSAWVEIDDNTTIAAYGMTADQLEDMDVYSAAGADLGDVEEVLGTNAQTPSALAIDFDDDARYGDRDDVVVPMENFAWENNRLVLSAEPAAVSAMPTYDD